MGDVWFQSIMAQAPRICGMQLRPFSLAHEMTLAALGSPYLYDKAQASKTDLLTALTVCSKTLAEIQRDLFARPRMFRLFMWAWRWAPRNLDVADASFRIYLADFQAVPDHWTVQGGDAKGVKADWRFHIVRVLCGEYGMTEAQAWDCPLARARCYYDAYAESNGDNTLVSASEQAAIAEGKR